MVKQLKVIVNEEIHPDGMKLLRSKMDVVVDFDLGAKNGQIESATALLVRSSGQVREDLITRARNLKVIGRYGAGVDNIDVQMCQKLGIAVVYAPGVNAKSVAEMTIGQAINLRRNFIAQDDAVRREDWSRRDHLAGGDIRGSKIGLIGLGQIGLEVARISRLGFEMDVCYYDQLQNKDAEARFGLTFLSLNELLSTSDIVSLHIPYTPSTHNLIGRSELARMKRTGILLNFARGGIVDEIALSEALQVGMIAGAGLDVFLEEPLVKSSPLLLAPNTVFSPHTAGISDGASREISLSVVNDIFAIISGKIPKFLYPPTSVV